MAFTSWFGKLMVCMLFTQVIGQTPTSCPRFRVVRGAGGTAGARYVPTTTANLFAVTCCSNTSKPGWARPNNRCPVYAERDAGVLRCLNAVPFTIAQRACAVAGARMCTAAELTGQCGRGTGCQHDTRFIWSSTYDPACGLQNAPTLAPVPSTTAPTTRAPTLRNNCPGFKIQSGSGGVGGAERDQPRFAGPSELHEVSCCSDIALPGFAAPVGNCPVYAERDGGALTCLANANWSFANAFCRSHRARLCTSQELVLGCGSGLGCSFNQRMVWSSTPNPSCGSVPTQAPSTLQPTQVPTQFNNCPGYRIQAGTGGVGGSDSGDTPRYAGLSEQHETTCCSDQPIQGFQPPAGNCTVWSERDAGTNGVTQLICHPSANWTTAWTACNSVGARLCTSTELINGCGVGLGCNSNQRMIWSNTLNPQCNLPAPTVAPTTPGPTSTPTRVNNCPGYKVMRGNSRQDPTGGRFASRTELHAVTCCADRLIANTSSFFFPPDPLRNCTVYSERDAGGLTGCFRSATYDQAVSFCSAVGARLCTAVEIGNGCGQGTGCNFDGVYGWTSTPNPYCNGVTASPTFVPTEVPTKSPTPENSCPGYMIQAGNGGTEGRRGDRPRFAPPTSIAGVTCCSDTEIAGFVAPNASSNPRCPVWSERDAAALGGCLTQGNWSRADAFCRNGGARLCTPQELILGCGVGTGCQHNDRMIWSSQENPYCNSGITPNPTAQPTAPTATPTRQPTQAAACPGFRVVNGRGGDFPTSSGEPSRWANPSERHEVTCCSNTNVSAPGTSFRGPRNHTITYPNGTAVVSFCPVFAERDFGNGSSACGHSLSHSEAINFCSSRSARLCSRAELEAGCGQGSGCQHDGDVVWSSTANPYCNGRTAPPTSMPTTLAPTNENSCPGVRIQWGRGGPAGPIGGDHPRYAGLQERHAVTCCSDTPIAGFAAPINDCPVYAERDGGPLQCLADATFPMARSFCLSVGARLCTANELVLGCGLSLGCGHDNRMIWSSTCNPSCFIPCVTTGSPTASTRAPWTLSPVFTSSPTTGIPTNVPTRTPTNSPSTASAQRGSSDDDNSTGLFIVIVILLLIIVVVVPGAVWYLRKPASGGDSHDVPGFENPLYGEGDLSFKPGETSTDEPEEGMYDESTTGEGEESGYMDVAVGDDDEF